MTYRIKYYGPDGSPGCPSDFPWPDGEEFPTIEAARAAIHREVGNHDSWNDEEGHECWNESDEEGCGGFEIVPVAEVRG